MDTHLGQTTNLKGKKDWGHTKGKSFPKDLIKDLRNGIADEDGSMIWLVNRSFALEEWIVLITLPRNRLLKEPKKC